MKITFPSSYTEEGWAQADVEISVNCFRGLVRPYIEAKDIAPFTVALRKLYETLKGSATFKPLEDQFSLSLTAAGSGQVHVTGYAWSQAVHENKLDFTLELDQSYLLTPLGVLERLMAQVKSK